MGSFLTSTQSFYMSLSGFLISFVMLFYFIARFRESSADNPDIPDGELSLSHADIPLPGANAPAIAVTVKSLDAINGEILGFKEKIRQMQYLIDERKTLHQKQISEIIRNINNIVLRLENVEPQYIDDIQPNIQVLIEELEQLRTPPSPDASLKQNVYN